jgi:ABC-type phosphate transport system substrate-binding protein
VVIVHPQNDVKITPKNVQRIFLGKEKKFSNGLETIPINQVHGSSARELFDNNRLDRSSTQISAYWSKFVFTGKGVPPIEVSDDASVVDLVANNKNAIGYIEESQISDKVTSIKINE